MANLTQKDVVVTLDSSTGVAKTITSYCNAYSIAGALSLLEETGLGQDDRTFEPGVHGKTVTLSGFLNSTTNDIVAPHVSDRTSVAKTLTINNGAETFTAEMFPANGQISGNADALQTWSLDLTAEGAAAVA